MMARSFTWSSTQAVTQKEVYIAYMRLIDMNTATGTAAVATFLNNFVKFKETFLILVKQLNWWIYDWLWYRISYYNC